MSVLIELRSVFARAQDGCPLFEDINMELSGGEKVLLAAPLGSGKSLLLRWIAGFGWPDKGVVTVFGQDISAQGVDGLRALRRRIGFLTEDNILISNLKVIENCVLPLLYHTDMPHNEAMGKAMMLLDSVGFKGDPWELPGPLPMYVKKQVAIARALALDPEIIVCENLSAGLTEAESVHLFELILGYHGGALTKLLFVTSTDDNDADIIRPNRTLGISAGKIVEAAR